MAADQSPVLAALPLAAASLVHKRAQPRSEEEQWWRNFRAAAPVPVWQYVLELDREAKADPAFRFNTERWMEQHHPAFEDIVEGLHRAFRAGLVGSERLRYTQGWLAKMAWHRLGWHLARERAAGKTASAFDAVIGDMAAQLLVGWTNAEAHAAWLEPVRFIDQWRVAGTADLTTLAHAGVHAAELRLVQAQSE